MTENLPAAKNQVNFKKHMTNESAVNITRDQLIAFLNEDLAGEYQAIKADAAATDERTAKVKSAPAE